MTDRRHENHEMTIEQFLAFTEERPDDERWELIEGVPVLNASPTNFHQIIASNILAMLDAHQERIDAPWLPLIGIGTKVPASPKSLPQPDVMVHEVAPTIETTATDDAFVLFEVLSKSNSRSDQAWRKSAYASIPNCQHYVTVAQNKPSVTRFDRSTGWRKIEYKQLADQLELPCLGVSLPLLRIYRRTPVVVLRSS